MAISEERVSSDFERVIEKQKFDKEAFNSSAETDTMLDEIAAKVDLLNLEKKDVSVSSNREHETIQKQNELISTLTCQLKIIFEEYQAACKERDYYEELNETLIRCLEVKESKSQRNREDGTEDKVEKNKNDTEPGSTVEEADNKNTLQTDEETDKNERGNSSEAQKISIENKGITSAELTQLNRVLLREIFELRHQIETMKENIRDYLISDTDDQESECDSTISQEENEHSCDLCNPTELRNIEEDVDSKSQATIEYKNQDDEGEKLNA